MTDDRDEGGGDSRPGPEAPEGADSPEGAEAPEGTGLSVRWKAAMVVVAVVGLIALGLVMAVVVRLSCVPRNSPAAQQTQPLPAATPDSVGNWVDRGDSLINVGAPAGLPALKSGFDFWARAVAAKLAPQADTLPSQAHIQAVLDSLQVPGEVRKGAGDAGVWGLTLRPRSAVRARASYVVYPEGRRAQVLPLDLDNVSDVRVAGWHENGTLNVAATGMRLTDAGLRPVLVALRRDGSRWSAWDTLPPPDSLGNERSQPSLEDRPGAVPAFVVRTYPAHGLFDECVTCPHRYMDRIFRLEGGRLTFVSDQPEDGPYAAMVGFLEALGRGQRDETLRLSGGQVTDSAHELGLEGGYEERSWRLQPGQQGSDSVLVATHRGTDTFRFRMEFDGDHWRVVELGRAAPVQ